MTASRISDLEACAPDAVAAWRGIEAEHFLLPGIAAELATTADGRIVG
jgi:hypothetical protein